MRRRWVRWLVGSVLLAVVLTLAAAWGLDRNALSHGRHMLGTVQCLCLLYAQDHGDAMPPDLHVLCPPYTNASVIVDYATNDVEYFPGATRASNPATVLLREKHPDRHGRRWVASVDMSLSLAHSAP